MENPWPLCYNLRTGSNTAAGHQQRTEGWVEMKVREQMETLDQKDYSRLFNKAVYSVRKSVEGTGLPFIEDEGRIAASQAIEEVWARSEDLETYIIENSLEDLPLQAFINKRSRQRYYDSIRRPGQSSKVLAITELQGYAKVDRALANVEFYSVLDTTELKELAELVLDGYTQTEIAAELGTSQKTVSRRIESLRAFMAAVDTNDTRTQVRKAPEGLTNLTPSVQWFLSGYTEHSFLYQQCEQYERVNTHLINGHITHVRMTR